MKLLIISGFIVWKHKKNNFWAQIENDKLWNDFETKNYLNIL